ncbi:Evolutionarily conserved signaling intermediate in Toll pathway, mitochondrial [Aphelenchoides besseyi]|nr:Evolutionarily conserved signaling intermediate in Toll pathway, mitochondrial [Aphelenchoides besseyi]
MFLEAIELFKRRARNERGHVEFINSAMKQMKEFGLHKDLDIYKALLDVFPKGSLISRNQRCSCIFRINRVVVCACWMKWSGTWLPRLRYTNKYLDKNLQRDCHADLDFVESARLALEMMSQDKGTEITYSTVANDQNLIVSAQLPLQRRLIRHMPMNSTCFYIDGPFYVYLVAKRIPYITLTTPPIRDHEQFADKFIDHAELEDINSVRLYDGIMPEDDDPTIHEQTTETIFGLAATEKLSEASASAWITHLQFLCAPLKIATVILRINV